MAMDSPTPSDPTPPTAAAPTPTPPTPTPPGPPAPSPAAMLARFDRNEQLIFAGAAAAAIAVVIGAVSQKWTFDLMYWLMALGGLAAIALVYLGTDRTYAGYSGRTLLRIDAAIVGAYGLVDFGDLLSSLGDWGAADIILTIIEVAGAAALAYGAWAASGSSVTTDIMAAGRVMALEMADRFVYVGAVGILVGWFLLGAIANFYYVGVDSQLVVLAAVLVLTVRWLERNRSEGKLPAPAPWAVAGLSAIAVVLALLWIIRVMQDTLDFGDITTYIPLAIYLLALASLAVGAVLGVRSTAPGTMPGEPPAAPSA